jgi:hypothetical protein
MLRAMFSLPATKFVFSRRATRAAKATHRAGKAPHSPSGGRVYRIAAGVTIAGIPRIERRRRFRLNHLADKVNLFHPPARARRFQRKNQAYRKDKSSAAQILSRRAASLWLQQRPHGVAAPASGEKHHGDDRPHASGQQA